MTALSRSWSCVRRLVQCPDGRRCRGKARRGADHRSNVHQFDHHVGRHTASIETDINAAIGTIDLLYTNPGTVNIVFSVCGNSQAGCGGGFLAESNTADYPYTYSQYQCAGSRLRGGALQHGAGQRGRPPAPSGNQPGPGGVVQVTTADAQIVLVSNVSGCFFSTGGFTNACGQSYVGAVTLNIGAPLNYTTTPVSGQFSAIGGLEHEINEILGGGGQGSWLNQDQCNQPYSPDVGVLDLYRYASAGVPSFSSCNGTPAYLSVDGGVTSDYRLQQQPNRRPGGFRPRRLCPIGLRQRR